VARRLAAVALDSKGNLYSTLMHIGEVVMVKEDGSYDHIAWVPSREESGRGDLIGLDFDKDDTCATLCSVVNPACYQSARLSAP
jgi:hypothetical protein